MPSPTEVLTEGTLSGAISDEIVSLLHRYTGRGPTEARTYVHENLIVCLLGDSLTTAEQSLVTGGHYASVLDTRSLFQRTMRADFTEAVERLSGRTVIAFMSQSHIEPSFGLEAFVLLPVDGPA
ncbi:MAG: hypothetical protein QOH11_1623 [Solirubrobacteraceae bacterium]|jgi:uncharacterized protein YbcI|nr:hypothetical protein [Solirubrobacteraceae bacterium]